jgi:hypothetical protein
VSLLPCSHHFSFLTASLFLRKKTAAEQAKLDKAKKIGRCPMDFEWIKIEGGFRCAGGTHFVTDAEIDTI